MALSPNSFTSFSPDSPPSESEKQSLPQVSVLDQMPILPPTDAPTGVSESTPAPPPTNQTVTVVVSPTPEAHATSTWLKSTGVGALLGVAIGVAAGWYYHSKLPGEFESTARVQVTGPASAADAQTQIAILKSKAVLAAAAGNLEDERPFFMPPDQDAAKRISFLEKGLAVSPEVGSGAGSTLNLAFHGPHPGDTPKYLKSIVEAYKADLASRPAGSVAAPRPAPGSAAAPNSNDTERAKLQGELAALTNDEPSAIEKRIGEAITKRDADQARLKKIDRDLGAIRNAGSSRRDRLGVMEELGIKSERPEVPASVLADAKAAEENLRALQLKKLELGQRLGPDHRDMLALDDQMAVMKERIAKATAAAPAGPDELDKYRAKLEGEKTSVVSQAGIPAEAIAADRKLLAQVNDLRKRIEELPASQAPAPAPPPPAAPMETAVAFAVQAIVPTTEGSRVGPPWERSMVPGGAIGLMAGGFLGLLGSLFLSGSKTPKRASKPYRPLISPVARTSSPAVPITSGPKLAVPVFANVPKLADSPVEKKSASGWSPKLVAFSRPNSVEAEIFRIARRELTNTLHNRGHQVIPVTSPGDGDGKSFVAANLAISLAQAGKRVVLVDCDMTNTKMQELFRLTRLGDSLKSIMSSDVTLRMAVRSTEVPNLFLLPAGRGITDSLELLSRPKFREVIAELKASYEYVILDAPGTDREAELSIISGASDGAVLVVRNASDAPARAERAKNAVIAAGSRVLGAIVNAAPAPGSPTGSTDKTKVLALA